MVRVGGDVFVWIAPEIDEGDVFEFSLMIVSTPFGVAKAVGAEAGAEDFSGAGFAFEVLAEGTGSPFGRWVGKDGKKGKSVKVFGNGNSAEVAKGGEEINEFGESFGALTFFVMR